MTGRPLAPAHIAACAAEALTEELATYPKPGLVSPVDCGSHPDMDAACFRASIAAIAPFFAELAATPRAGFRDLQAIGLRAEDAMWAATRGRNTHRGAIFCLGLLAAAAGRRHEEPGRTLGEIVAARWGGAIPQAKDLPGVTAGIALCRDFDLGGVRREAALGFPSVFLHALPALRAASDRGRNAARVQAFFVLLTQCEDTTLFKRGGADGARFAQAQARHFLGRGGVHAPDWERAAETIHHAFVARNLTAGGAADLLAAAILLDLLDRKEEENPTSVPARAETDLPLRSSFP